MKKMGYYLKKIVRAKHDGILWEKGRRFLLRTLRIPLSVSFNYLTLSITDRQRNLLEGFADHRTAIHHYRSRPEHLLRIIAAYKKAKELQSHVSLPFHIRGLWAEWIAVNFGPLVHALQQENLSALSRLFENFHREPYTRGLGSSYDTYMKYRTSLTGRWYYCTVWKLYRDRLRNLGIEEYTVRFPLIGNPAGVLMSGQIIPIEALRHSYHAVVIRDLLHSIQQAVVVEIGAGTGGQAYQTTQQCGCILSKYVVFDIPEVAAISSYFLLSAFPEKRFRLFGEGAITVDQKEQYDLAVFPHFAITELADQSVDMFYNSCSFSEMDSMTAQEYLHIIERVCRKYFLHENHDGAFRYRNDDGSFSINLIGSQLIPDSKLFRRVFKKNRTFNLPEDKEFPAFEYLYERIV